MISVCDGSRRRIAVVALLVASVQACCHKPSPPLTVSQVELQSSATQTLVVVNDLETDVALIAADGSVQPPLSPGARISQPFVVVSLADLEQPAGVTWSRISPTGRADYVTGQTVSLLATAGRDVELRIRRGEGPVQPLLLTLQGCTPAWSDQVAAAAEHTISLAAAVEALPGVPQRLCPQTSTAAAGREAVVLFSQN